MKENEFGIEFLLYEPKWPRENKKTNKKLLNEIEEKKKKQRHGNRKHFPNVYKAIHICRAID